MSEHLRLGRIAGVAIGINWSVAVIFLLIVWGLAGGRFPAVYPEASTAAHVTAGIVAGVVFLLSLLAHEVSHAIVASRNGIDVDGITLWMFGGVARLRGEARDAGAELRISGVGPLVSLVLGALFLGLAAVLGAAGINAGEDLVAGVLVWLGVINIVLAVFNLLPAAPLDGGRILRAALWRWRGDRLRASITAARAGKALAVILIGLGFAQFVFTGALGGLWLVLIGWFLVTAAAAEERQAEARRALGGVPVADVMSRDPATAPAAATVEDFIDSHVLRQRFSAYPLVDDEGRPQGLVTVNRVRQVPPDRRSTTTVRDIACGMDEVATAAPDDSAADVVERMSACADGRALVLDDDHVVGIVSPTDVVRRLEVVDLADPRDREHV